jgi:hypothetical protein
VDTSDEATGDEDAGDKAGDEAGDEARDKAGDKAGDEAGAAWQRKHLADLSWQSVGDY